MPKIIIMMGLPGSGKSSYVNKTLVPKGFQVICADDLRLAHGHAFYGPLEPQIHGLIHTLVRAFMYRKLNIVVDECTVRAPYLARWVRLAEDMGYSLEVRKMDTPLDTCMDRRAKQNPDFPMDVIEYKHYDLTKEWEDIKRVLGDLPLITIHNSEEAETNA